MSRHRLSPNLADESGVALVTVAIWLPVALLILILVVDVGNWFVHRDHLQAQADASVLAAAGDYRIPCSDQPILDRAHEYGGDTYNAQVGGTPASRVHMLVNSSSYFGQTSPTDTTVNTSPPCAAGMIDVKLTETDLPWFFRLAGVPFINAHARVSIRQIDRSTGALPVAVPDVNPKAARAEFINEATGAVLASRALTRVAGSSGGLVIWDNSASPLPVTVDAANIGVRIALSGSTTTTCGSALVECYDLGSANGIMRVRGWTGAGSAAQPNAPLARDVTLFDGSCTDPYFVAGATCTVGVRAKVDFGTGASDPTTSTAPGVGARLDAVVGGTTYPMTYSTGTGAWTSTATIPVTSGAGPLTVDLQWTETRGTQGGNTCTTTGGNKCKGTIADVHRTFGASTARSGPIRLAQVWEGGTFWANSFERCSTVQTSCTHNLVVKIGLQGSLADAKSVNDPIVSLRVVGGSQNQSLDCDPGLSQLKAELAQGCSPSYAINTGTACPGSASALWGSPQPWNCVALQTGTAVNQVPAGLNKRILGDEKPTSCTSPNHWSSFPAIPKDDPRIAPVFLAPYGSFNGSGNGVVPVTDFGAFYITGWTAQGSGFANPCQGNGDDPVPGNDAGYIVGHFIKYVQTINDGSGGDNACDQNAFGSCVAVLTE